MNHSSSSSYPRSGACSHERALYERQPYDVRVSNSDQVPGASDFINDFDETLALVPALSTSSAPFPTASSLSYSPVDVKGMTMSTPHSPRPQTAEPPLHDDGLIYLHSPYGQLTTSYWNNMSAYPPMDGSEQWTTFEPSLTNPLHSNISLSNFSPPSIATPLQQDRWNFDPTPPLNMQITPVPVHDVQHPSTSASSDSPSSSRSVICQWGQRCGVALNDLTAAGIARHLKEYHVQDWDNRARGRCEWNGSPCTNTTMFYASFGKHIASVHLGATARPCEKCGETFARADTLDRHMKLYCRLRGK
ncbi:hypothetical protein DAEQUDRAFT_764652 [Daedalea quercina L-15889]|uniref:C2H2-type domain-containing protein n=1 Tax=Daedalea quercina L-15889 TaxID=1314783 RepID=A0A165R9V1_9APHY|nr:hypothetical protein DAEQUDRAFT_764652 [Daedalea quercina L-15889]